MSIIVRSIILCMLSKNNSDPLQVLYKPLLCVVNIYVSSILQNTRFSCLKSILAFFFLLLNLDLYFVDLVDAHNHFHMSCLCHFRYFINGLHLP
jgi:hypothetical protein